MQYASLRVIIIALSSLMDDDLRPFQQLRQTLNDCLIDGVRPGFHQIPGGWLGFVLDAISKRLAGLAHL
jgi:hypothetical protein